MKRKIVRQGNGALTISLPASWTKRLGLKAGQELNVEEKETTLVITAEKREKETIIVDITKLNEVLVWTYLLSAYRNGYDIIKVKHKGEQTKLIQQVVDAMLGMAITEQNNEETTIVDLMENPADREFASIFRRIFYMLEEMGDCCLEAIKKKQRDNLASIVYQDYNINKFSNFCIRMIKKKFMDGTIEYIVSELENIGDEYARLGLNLAKFASIRISKEMINLLREVNELFVNFHKLYYSFTDDAIVEIVEHKEKINKKLAGVEIKSKQELVLSYHLSKIVHLVISMTERVVMLKQKQQTS